MDTEPIEPAPLGIMPNHQWQARRAYELAQAIQRYIEAGRVDTLTVQWCDELHEHLTFLADYRASLKQKKERL